jgi:hypothetical protein
MAGFIETDDGSALSDMEAVWVQYERMIALYKKVLSIAEGSGHGLI